MREACVARASLANSGHPGFSGRFHCGLSPAFLFFFFFDGFFFIPWVIFHPYFSIWWLHGQDYLVATKAKSLPGASRPPIWAVASLSGILLPPDERFGPCARQEVVRGHPLHSSRTNEVQMKWVVPTGRYKTNIYILSYTLLTTGGLAHSHITMLNSVCWVKRVIC